MLVQFKDLSYEEKILDLQDQLSQQMLMVASIVHELRTPLNCSITLLEVLDEVMTQRELCATYLEPSCSSLQIMSNLVNDILDFSQLNHGQFKYTHVEFNPRELL